jgi:hypothetical protein
LRQSPLLAYAEPQHGGRMTQLSDNDYYALDHFVQAVLARVRHGICSVSEGRSDLMHVLSAWDKGNWTEFAPWMMLQQERWGRSDA